MRYLGLLAVGAIFGLFGVLIHYSSLMFGDLFQVAARNLIGFVLILPIIFWRKISLWVSKTELLWLLVYGVLTVSSFSFVTMALVAEPIKTVLVIRYMGSIIISLLLTKYIFKESLTWVNYSAAGLALLGISFFAFPFTGFITIGVIYAFLATVTFVLSNVIIKQINSLKPEILMGFEFGFIAFVLLGLIAVSDAPTVVSINPLSIVVTGLFGVLLLVVTYLIIYGFRETNFNIANIILTSEIFFGVLFGYVFLGQLVSGFELLGILAIFVAAIVPNVMSLYYKNKFNERNPQLPFGH